LDYKSKLKKIYYTLIFFLNIRNLSFKSSFANIKGSNNSITSDNSSIKNCKLTIVGNSNKIVLGKTVRASLVSVSIYGNNNTIHISDNVSILDLDIYIEDDHNIISINKNTSIHGSTHLAVIEGTSINIGSDCMFSSNIQIRTGDSHSITNLKGDRLNCSSDVHIGDHVWIGTGVICLKGVTIPNNCIVGAASLLTGQFTECNSIIAGNPARLVKSNIDWMRERI